MASATQIQEREHLSTHHLFAHPEHEVIAPLLCLARVGKGKQEAALSESI